MGQYVSTKTEGNQTNCISSPFSSCAFQVACCLVLVCLQPKWAWVEVDQVSSGNFMILAKPPKLDTLWIFHVQNEWGLGSAKEEVVHFVDLLFPSTQVENVRITI